LLSPAQLGCSQSNDDDRCPSSRTELWDIETIDEFDNISARIYNQTPPNYSFRLAVNFTNGRRRKFRGYLFTDLFIFRSITFK
jgi:hypothetical protein